MVSETLLNSLQEAASDLNEASDSLNDTISSVEKSIQASGVGLDAWVFLEAPKVIALSAVDGGDSKKQTPILMHQGAAIGYTKLKDDWVLAYASRCAITIKRGGSLHECERYQVEHVVPLNSAPRAVRNSACAKFDELLEALIARSKYFAVDIQRAIEIAKR